MLVNFLFKQGLIGASLSLGPRGIEERWEALRTRSILVLK